MEPRRAACTLLALCTLFAMSAAPGKASQQPPATSATGVENARAAGISVSDAAARAMAEAPVGSCYNDPTQAKCPPATRMEAPVVGGEAEAPTEYAPLDDRDADAHKVAMARSYGIPQCGLFAEYPGISGPGWYPTHYAFAKSRNQCHETVIRQELYVTLQRQANGAWHNLGNGFDASPGGYTLYVTARFDV
jgi:hypothetical protein